MLFRSARGERLAGDLYGDIYAGDHFLTSEETLRWFREEVYPAGPVIDRDAYDTWVQRGKKSAWDRARQEVDRILGSHKGDPMPDDRLKALTGVIEADARRMGIDLPPLD